MFVKQLICKFYQQFSQIKQFWAKTLARILIRSVKNQGIQKRHLLRRLFLIGLFCFLIFPCCFKYSPFRIVAKVFSFCNFC
nr:MAG TPA: hypothetical protein [Caudoviricetes sp.]